MALAGEVGELLEHFQWLTAEQSAELPDETREKVEQEIADVLIYLTALADRLGIAIGPAVVAKMGRTPEPASLRPQPPTEERGNRRACRPNHRDRQGAAAFASCQIDPAAQQLWGVAVDVTDKDHFASIF